MNELQLVLLIFAVVVIAGLYFMSRDRLKLVQKETKSSDSEKSMTHDDAKNQDIEHTISGFSSSNPAKDFSSPAHQKASAALNELGQAHLPVNRATERMLIDDYKEQGESVPANQGSLDFGEDFEVQRTVSQTDNVDSKPALNQNTEHNEESNQNNKHYVVEVDDPGMIGVVDSDSVSPDHPKPSFGIPDEDATKSPVSNTGKEPEVFILLVMGTGSQFPMKDVVQSLLGVGLTLSEQQIYVRNDNMGNKVIKVANILEPGTFPVDQLENYSTPGVVMILELPTSVHAPKAMNDLIMMARKVSQRLNGRLYNKERQLIGESYIQSMRDTALDYESEPLT